MNSLNRSRVDDAIDVLNQNLLLRNNHLDLTSTSMHDDAAEAFANSLATNTSVQRITLAHAAISKKAMECIANGLMLNNSITALDVLGVHSSTSVLQLLRARPQQLRSLALDLMTPEDVELLIGAIQTNTVLNSLALSFSSNVAGPSRLFGALREQKSVHRLSITGGVSGSDDQLLTTFYEFIANSRTLQSLTFDCRVSYEQERPLKAALRKNLSLLAIDGTLIDGRWKKWANAFMHRNKNFQSILDVCIALAPLDLPQYPTLWIVDNLPMVGDQHVSHITKLRFIERIIASIRRIYENRPQTDATTLPTTIPSATTTSYSVVAATTTTTTTLTTTPKDFVPAVAFRRKTAIKFKPSKKSADFDLSEQELPSFSFDRTRANKLTTEPIETTASTEATSSSSLSSSSSSSSSLASSVKATWNFPVLSENATRDESIAFGATIPTTTTNVSASSTATSSRQSKNNLKTTNPFGTATTVTTTTDSVSPIRGFKVPQLSSSTPPPSLSSSTTTTTTQTSTTSTTFSPSKSPIFASAFAPVTVKSKSTKRQTQSTTSSNSNSKTSSAFLHSLQSEKSKMPHFFSPHSISTNYVYDDDDDDHDDDNDDDDDEQSMLRQFQLLDQDDSDDDEKSLISSITTTTTTTTASTTTTTTTTTTTNSNSISNEPIAAPAATHSN